MIKPTMSKEEMFKADWKISSSKWGYHVRTTDKKGSRYVYLGCFRDRLTYDREESASFDSRAHARSAIKAWLKPEAPPGQKSLFD